MINYFYIKFRVYQNRSEQKLMGKKKYTNISNILEKPFTALLNWYQIFVSSFMHNPQKKNYEFIYFDFHTYTLTKNVHY